MTETRWTFRLFYGLLAVVATAAVSAFLSWSAFGHQVRVVTQTRPEPGLTASSTAAEAKARYQGDPAQTVNGPDIGLPDGIVCDAYELSDGVSLVCYPGGSA